MATRNRYAEIMAQYAQSQPYSFFGYPQSYSGGYDVAQPQAYAAPASRYEEIMGQQAMGGGGNRGKPVDYNPEWTGLSDAEKAAFYASSPFFSGATQLGQKLFGATSLGALQKGLVPDFVARQKLIAMGIDPATMDYSNEGRNYPATTGTLSFAPPTEAQYGAYLAQQQADAAGREYGTGAVPPTMTQNQFAAQYAAYGAGQQPAASTGGFTPYSGTQNAVRSYDAMGREISKQQAEQGGFGAVVSNPRSAAEAQARADAAAAQANADAAANVGFVQAPGESGRGGGPSGGGAATGGRDTGGGRRDASGGGDRGTRGGFAQGGYVSMQHLGGPDPEGPDDGYAALKDGEFVINDKAVKKYGIELMQAINSGKISKGKLRGLLEM